MIAATCNDCILCTRCIGFLVGDRVLLAAESSHFLANGSVSTRKLQAILLLGLYEALISLICPHSNADSCRGEYARLSLPINTRLLGAREISV